MKYVIELSLPLVYLVDNSTSKNDAIRQARDEATEELKQVYFPEFNLVSIKKIR